MTDKNFDNVGVLFKNDKREKDSQPTHKGKLRVGGVDYWLSGWVNAGANGPYIKISVDKKEGPTPEQIEDVF